jgi:hypothetical protein
VDSDDSGAVLSFDQVLQGDDEVAGSGRIQTGSWLLQEVEPFFLNFIFLQIFFYIDSN